MERRKRKINFVIRWILTVPRLEKLKERLRMDRVREFEELKQSVEDLKADCARIRGNSNFFYHSNHTKETIIEQQT